MDDHAEDCKCGHCPRRNWFNRILCRLSIHYDEVNFRGWPGSGVYWKEWKSDYDIRRECYYCHRVKYSRFRDLP